MIGINNGRFKDSMFAPPLKKAPFGVLALKSATRSDIIVDYLIQDPEVLESELKMFDSVGASN